MNKIQENRESQERDHSEDSQPTKRYARLTHALHSNLPINTNTSRFALNYRCAFHNEQKITNFCRNSQCLLPLCPKCVGVHSQQHAKMGVFGDFITLIQAFEYSTQQLHRSYERLDDLGNRINMTKSILHDKESTRKVSMLKTRQKIIEYIKQFLDDLQNALNSISQIADRCNRNRIEQIEQYKNKLLQQCNICLKKSMNDDQRLQGIIQYYYNRNNFQEIEDIQKIIIQLNNSNNNIKIQDKLDYNNLEQILKQNILIFNYRQQILNDLTIRRQKRKQNNNNLLNINKFNYKQRLDNFISPLQSFNLEKNRLYKYYKP